MFQFFMLIDLKNTANISNCKSVSKCMKLVFLYANYSNLSTAFKWSQTLITTHQQLQYMQLKSTRRKRKDPESRDFTCRCGRSYLSYAAAYTHVKNKHQLDKSHLEDIGRPQREKLPRGRPKDRKQMFSNVQVEELSILQQAILKIYQLLSAKFNHMILDGNNTLNAEELQRRFGQLNNMYSAKIGVKIYQRGNENELRFVKDICRHFTGEVAARIKLSVLAIAELRKKGQVGQGGVWQKVQQELNNMNLWQGQNEVNKILCSTLIRWQQVRENH